MLSSELNSMAEANSGRYVGIGPMQGPSRPIMV